MKIAMCLLMLVFAASYADYISLQEAYDAAGPGDGYDKLLELDPNEVYSGMLLIDQEKRSCIHGNGALINQKPLGSSRYKILVFGENTVLDIDHCVIIHASEGVAYYDGSTGKVVNNTFYDCYFPVYLFASDSNGTERVTAYNNIFSNAPYLGYAFARDVGTSTVIHHNNVWDCPDGKYMELCGGWGGDWESFSPEPGTGEIESDPMFNNPDGWDFRLKPGSPCIGAGEGGVDMGALPFDLQSVNIEPASIGSIKAVYTQQ